MTPNATCPVCGVRVYFYANSNGSRVFFDDVGPPWPKHPCTDRVKLSSTFLYQVRMAEITAQYGKKPAARRSLDRDGWRLFKALHTKSFRQELEHVASGRKFETNILKDNIPGLGQAIWIREQSHNTAEVSYFDLDNFKVVSRVMPNLEARKYATMGEWLPFSTWFRHLLR
ncbi:hypothetical protein [Microvirga splendida]|uniref:Uncharacterized protein n=1 Tax=Microvirga splendida TaxID=2795727 RepID=A0ABS0XZB0_9HYPH|nr:hypothetical protein [Microvirga splendida]MBJ6125395.1 hypothetical protein [Microvirga splendida]